MILSSLELRNVIRVGSNTEGVFSDMLDKPLPNGWEFSLSNEVYLDNKGNNYEGVGIPPQVEMPYSRNKQEFLGKIMSDIDKQGDATIEKVMEMVNNSQE